MYSFLNDKELYGSTLSDQTSAPTTRAHAMHQGGSVTVQTQGARERPADVVARPPPAPNPNVIPEIFFKSLAVLEQRLMSLEERVVVALEKLSSEAVSRPHNTESVGINFWTFSLAVALATALLFCLMNFLRPRLPPVPPQASPMPFVIQSLPPPQSPPQLISPPTPIIFSAPASFLPRS